MAVRTADFSGLFCSSSVEGAGINSVRKGIGYLASVFMALLLLNLPLYAQNAEDFNQDVSNFHWPEKLVNLQELPKDWTGSRLSSVMNGFTRALGVRCEHCHVGEAGQPLSSYDFVTDENPNKDRAREMLRMLKDINGHLKKIEPSGDRRVNMWCTTCHRGIARPISLGEQLRETFRAEGLEASLTKYSELKKNFYGKGAYQFGESALNELGYTALRENPKGAIKAFKLNSKEYPESWNVWDSLADGYMQSGDNKNAKKYYKKSLKLNPNNQNAKDMLEKIKKG